MPLVKKPEILCVDDESNVLDGLKLILRQKCKVSTCTSGGEGLDLIRSREDAFAVIVSDMKMPLMNGAAFLREARKLSPTTTRILLTGFSEMDAAIEAINEGGIFRFLTKPSQPKALVDVVDEGLQLHSSITAEKVLLEQTLKEGLSAVCQVLALSSPDAYGRALRIERLVRKAAQILGDERWELPLAAMLSQLGWAMLDSENLQKALSGLSGANLGDVVQKAKRAPVSLFESIPRIEPIKDLLQAAITKPNLKDPLPHRLLRATIAYDDGLCRAQVPSDVLSNIRQTHGVDVADALSEALNNDGAATTAMVSKGNLAIGMVLDKDLKNKAGSMILPAGVELTQPMVERLRAMSDRMISGSIAVRLKPEAE